MRLLQAAIALAVVWSAAVFAAPLTIEEIVTLKRVTVVKLAPDGQRIAYLLQVPRTPYVDDDGPPHSELHVTDLEGLSRAYVTGDVNVREVAWSSDGASLYYLAKRNEDEFVSLYAIRVDGGESRKVYEHGADIQTIRPAPVGGRLAFLAPAPAPEHEKRLEEKGFKAVVYEESVRAVDAWLLDLPETGDSRSASHAAADRAAIRLELPGSASELEWAPDGERLVVALAPTPLVDDSYISRRLHIVEASGGRVVRRLEHTGKLGPFAWSPGGDRVAFVGAVDEHDPLEGRVFVATADGEDVTNLTPDYAGHVHEVAWRDENTLWYRGSRGLWTEIDTLDAAGRSLSGETVLSGPIARDFDARGGAPALAVVAETPRHPPEVYAWQPQSGYRRLTNSNPLLDERDLAPQEPAVYRARDGLELEGVLVRPLNERRGRRYPLILAIHGGPESHFSNGWMSSYTFPAQTMAAEDYAFFYPNYRASSGRGVEFSMLDHGDPAGREFDDLVDAKVHFVDAGLADVDRIGISGGSYGGYATMWAATALTEHFAAGVAFVGLSDLIFSLGTSDIPNELYLVHLRAWPWDDWQFALERSPIYHAGRARTPLLILGGDADPRVDPSQSLALYRNIKLRTETPVRLVQYPGEGHGNRNTAAQLDYALRMKRWMDHYLKGPGGAPPPYELDHAQRLAPEAADGTSEQR